MLSRNVPQRLDLIPQYNLYYQHNTGRSDPLTSCIVTALFMAVEGLAWVVGSLKSRMVMVPMLAR